MNSRSALCTISPSVILPYVSRLCLGCMTFGEPDRGRHARRFRKRAAARLSSTPLKAASTSSIPQIATRRQQRRDRWPRPARLCPPRRGGCRHQGVSPVGDLAEGLSRAQILRSIDDSLRRLGMDYVDLLQIHRWDYTTPIEETLEALDEVVKAGKARYIGASSMHARQFARWRSSSRTAGRASSPCRITTT